MMVSIPSKAVATITKIIPITATASGALTVCWIPGGGLPCSLSFTLRDTWWDSDHKPAVTSSPPPDPGDLQLHGFISFSPDRLIPAQFGAPLVIVLTQGDSSQYPGHCQSLVIGRSRWNSTGPSSFDPERTHVTRLSFYREISDHKLDRKRCPSGDDSPDGETSNKQNKMNEMIECHLAGHVTEKSEAGREEGGAWKQF